MMHLYASCFTCTGHPCQKEPMSNAAYFEHRVNDNLLRFGIIKFCYIWKPGVKLDEFIKTCQPIFCIEVYSPVTGPV